MVVCGGCGTCVCVGGGGEARWGREGRGGRRGGRGEAEGWCVLCVRVDTSCHVCIRVWWRRERGEVVWCAAEGVEGEGSSGGGVLWWNKEGGRKGWSFRDSIIVH